MVYFKPDPNFIPKHERIKRIKKKLRCTDREARKIESKTPHNEPKITKPSRWKGVLKIRRELKCTYAHAKKVYDERQSQRENEESEKLDEVHITAEQLRQTLVVLNNEGLDSGSTQLWSRVKRKCMIAQNANVNLEPKERIPLNYLNIVHHMKDCILTHNWDGLTELLVIFYNAPDIYDAIKWRNALINIFNNNNIKKFGLLDDFLDMIVRCQTDEDKENFIKYVTSTNLQLFGTPVIKNGPINVDGSVDVSLVKDENMKPVVDNSFNETVKNDIEEEVNQNEPDFLMNCDDYFNEIL